jgi:hypothetical protein
VSVEIPADLEPLLHSTAVAFVSTIGPKGEPQTTLTPDPELALERAVAEKYVGEWVDIEPPDTARFAAALTVERFTRQ